MHIAPGSGSFTFVDRAGDASRPLTVFTYLAHGAWAETAAIVFALHGVGRNARGMRDTWIGHAERNTFLILAPQFDTEHWGHGDYAYASVLDRNGKPRDPALWSYSVIEHLFDAVKQATGNRRTGYLLYGHSDGGQFVHRLVLLLPNARYELAAAANPGWYMMPRFDVRYPFGLGQSPVTEASLTRSFARRLVLLLGDRDIDPNHPQLNRSVNAMAQGTNRFERGHAFIETATKEAGRLGCSLAWQLQVVPGVAHENDPMVRAAAPLLAAANAGLSPSR